MSLFIEKSIKKVLVMKTKRSILILSILIIVLFSLTTVVASDINSTDVINESVDTDLSISNEIDYESNASDENQEVLSASDEDVISAGSGTFSDLQKEIKSAEGILILNKDYYATKPGWFSSSSVTINKDIIINGQGHTLDAKQFGRIFKITGGKVTLVNIKFINGFESKNGGAIYCEDAKSLTIDHCIFENNAVKSSKEIHGGAIYCENTDLKITYSIFKKNSVVGSENSGGGAVTRRIGNLDKLIFEVTNCQFIENTISKGGRSAAIETWCERTSSDHRLDNSKTIIKDCSFEKNIILDNHGKGKYGTVIASKVILGTSYYGSNDVFVERCDFIYNDGGMGVISVSCGACVVSNSFFYMNNRDGTCDCIYKDMRFGLGDAFINNIIVDNSRETLDCGPGQGTIYPHPFNAGNNFFGSTSTIIVEPNCGKTRANVFYQQGVLFLDQTNFHMEEAPHKFNLEFVGCYNGVQGFRRGGMNENWGSYDFSHFKYDVYDENGNLIKANLSFKFEGGYTKSSFEYKFPTAGAHELNFYYRGYKVATIKIRIDYDDSFSELDNVVKKSAKSGILNLTKDYHFYDIFDDTFLNGIDISGITRIIGNGHIIDCKHIASAFNYKTGRLIIENLTIINGYAYDHGAALSAIDAYIELKYCKFIGNVAENAGGAVFNGGQIDINNCTFVNNTATNYAAAVQSNTLVISNSLFSQNHVNSSGGAVSAMFLNSTNVTFELNTAQIQGGAIFAFFTNIINNTFYYNYAGDGGAAYVQNSSIVDSLFINNVATGKGGAVYHTSDTFNITGSEFRFNEAGVKGGAIFISYGNGNINDAIFDNNHAQDIVNGTAIWIENAYVLISNSTFEDDEYGEYYIIFNYNDKKEVTATDCSFSEDPNEITHQVNLKNNKITSPTAPKGKSSVKISPIANVTYGKSVLIEVNITNKTAPSYIIRNGVGKVVKSGRLNGDLIVLSDLDPGRYTITVVNPENGTVDKSSANATFNIGKIDSGVTIDDIETVVYGENTIIRYHLENPTLTYFQILKDGLWSRLDVVNSNEIVLKLDAGNYAVEIINVGTSTHNPSSTRKNFNVSQAGSKIDLVANEEYPYDSVCIYADVENSTTVKAVIKDSNNEIVYNSIIKNGFILPDLRIGTYNLTVYNEESRNYRNSSASILFNVEKAINNIYISANNVSYGEETVINVTADVDGIYTLQIGDETVYVSVDQGFGTISLALDAGDYTANTTFADSNFTAYIENATFNVKKAEIVLSMTIFDRIYSANITGTVYSNVDGKYNVSCAGNDVIVSVVNGMGQFDLGQLDAGNYTAVVCHEEDINFRYASNETQFKVTQTGTNFNIISSTDVTAYGNNITLTVGLPENARGTVTYTFANGTEIITVDVNGSVNLSNLNAGTYEIYGFYSGDENYDPANDNIFITIEKYVIKVEIKVDDVCYPDEVELEVLATLDGEYTILIDDSMSINVIVKDGSGKTKFTLKPEVYVAKVMHNNENYILNTTEKVFTVNKGEVNVSIEVLNKVYTENITGNIYASVDGKYIVKLDDINFTVDVTDNIAEFTLPPMGAGTYTIYVIFEADGYFNERINQTTFEINSTGTSFNLIPNSTAIVYGDKIELMHNLPEDATGSITYMIDKNPLPDGMAHESIILNLASGKHVVYAKYTGDAQYYPAEDSVTITVYKLEIVLTIKVENTTYMENISGTVTSSLDGEYKLWIEDSVFNITVENGVANFSIDKIFDVGIYDAFIDFEGNDNYEMTFNRTSFEIKSLPDDKYNFTFETVDKTIVFHAPSDAKGNVTVTIGNKTYDGELVNGTVSILVPELAQGSNNVIIAYSGDDSYAPRSFSANISIETKVIASDMTRGYNSGLDYQFRVVDINGNPISNKNVKIQIKDKSYTVKTDNDGFAKLNVKLSVGSYGVIITNPDSGNAVNKNLKIVKRFDGNKNIAKYYNSNFKYKFRVIGDDGKAVGKGVKVKVKVGKKTYTFKTDDKGYITIKLTKIFTPKKYTVTASYKGYTIKNTINVKQVLSAKTVKVKKSAKKLVLKAKLKQGKKALKNKKVTFKFKGKKYTAKTNKKGIAKVTVKKNVIKKLKAGKKYAYNVTYLKDTIKKYVKVKR
jgi:predicted outer membrane repeat protein